MDISSELQTDSPVLSVSDRKSTAPVHLAVCQEIGAAGYLFLYSQKNGLHNILDVNKRQILPAETYGKVRVLTDGLCHQEIIFLARTVHTRRTINDVRETRYALQINLRFQFTKAISSVGHRSVFFRNRSIVFSRIGPNTLKVLIKINCLGIMFNSRKVSIKYLVCR